MGNKVPVPDNRLQKMIDQLKLSKKDLGNLWRVFQRYDRDKGGTIDVAEFYRLIEEEQTVFGDSLFELVDIDCSGALDFSEFVQTLGTYCLFGRIDVLRFCFYLFDKDKSGYIDSDELHALVSMLHADNPTSNCRTALSNLDTNNDGRIDFDEFQQLNVKFPMLLFPAFRMQENMMANTLGTQWWKGKKTMLQEHRNAENAADEKQKLKELQRQRRMAARQVQHKMGSLSYYLCFFKRAKVLSQIAAEDAVRAEKREKKRIQKDKLKQQQKNRKDLEDLFKDTGDGADDDADQRKRRKHKKKKKNGDASVRDKKDELKKRKKQHKERKDKKSKGDASSSNSKKDRDDRRARRKD